MWGLKVTGISAALGEEVLVALTSHFLDLV